LQEKNSRIDDKHLRKIVANKQDTSIIDQNNRLPGTSIYQEKNSKINMMIHFKIKTKEEHHS